MKKTILFFFISFVSAYAQYNGNKFSLGINGLYTTTAKIYLYPNSENVVQRYAYNGISDIFDYGANLRYRLIEDLILDLNVEYMEKNNIGDEEKFLVIGEGIEYLKMNDSFKLIPLELSLYYILPFSGERFKFFMGGGGAAYFGNFSRNAGSINTSVEKRRFAYGIQVGVGFDYLIKDNLAAKFEMKFRDPEFTITSIYNENSGTYGGKQIQILEKQFDTKINVDGVTFAAGLSYQF